MEKEQLNAILQGAGIVSGIGIFFVALAYVLGPSYMVGPWSNWISFFGVLGGIIFVALKQRKALGGFWSFGQAFKFIFLVSLGFVIVIGLFEYLLFHVIDPDFYGRVMEETLQLTYERFTSFGLDDESMSEIMEKTEERLQDQASFKGVLFGMGIRVIVYAVLALIVGAFVKKKDPEIF